MAFTINHKNEITEEQFNRLKDITLQGTNTKAIYKAVGIVLNEYQALKKENEELKKELQEVKKQFNNFRELIKKKNELNSKIMRLSVNF